ncbi:fungal-specific transcription factor domain-containing protein [Talaromyces proteolyticus]|uniref:Fungal-specific transcription factor domain-containing protein n=1 Tax=Talaromyces proteolyticus TaxID=1131652 RepID=A0AAD4KKX2_9EURO|nr:fungal-specific transcription factor domain-containing protein [Talaromyces proteolyticus]KAH8693972.1 fungal-specific transcription factor domain-containing protein [Talaromyces proteolyticus]
MYDKNSPPKEARRRQRQTLSCLPCRRLKVKCDRNYPCGHCIWSERASSCRYAAFPGTSETSAERASTGQLPPTPTYTTKQMSYILPKSEPGPSTPSTNTDSLKSEEDYASFYNPHAVWTSKFRGPTHWLAVGRQLRESMGGFETVHKAQDSLVNGMADRITRVSSSVLSPNYPMGSGYRTKNMSKAEILTFIPDQATATFLLTKYMEDIERTHPLLHMPTFQEEFTRFWENPGTIEDGWLAQFLVMLGLSYHALRNEELMPYDEQLAIKYFQGAEICLKNTPFLVGPTITSLRTLTMMVLARRTASSTCLEADSCGPLMSTVVRLAMSIGLHVDPQDDENMSIIDIEIRRRLWTTIVLMEVQMSITNGTPFLIRTTDFDTRSPTNVNDDDLSPSITHLNVRPMTEYTDSTFSIILARSFQVTFEVMGRANSPCGFFDYEDVLRYNSELKNLLQESSSLYQWTDASPLEEWKQLQRFMLEIYLRRVLLALHSHHGLKPNADINYPISYWSTLESSLALLVTQRQMCEDINSPRGMVWLAELFKHDFYAATLTICLLLARNDSMYTGMDCEGPLDQHIEIPQRETILQTLICCREIWARRICRTYCQFLSHMNLDTIISGLTAPDPSKLSSRAIRQASFQYSLRKLKNCQCGNCATQPGSLKVTFIDHPEYVAA